MAGVAFSQDRHCPVLLVEDPRRSLQGMRLILLGSPSILLKVTSKMCEDGKTLETNPHAGFIISLRLCPA